jgi:hypothetical protein
LEININESATAQEIEKLIQTRQEELRLDPVRAAEKQRTAAEEDRRLSETLRIQQEKEQQRLEHLQKRQQLEENLRKKQDTIDNLNRVKEYNKNSRTGVLLSRVNDLNIIIDDDMTNEEIEQKISEQTVELNRLRMEAVRLKIDTTERIMREYTLKQLKTVIKQWRKNNERPLT